MNDKLYLVKDLSEMSGFSAYTIKYYLKRGLIKESGRSPGTNFRYFDDDTVEALKKIMGYRRDKMPISKIMNLMGRPAR